MFFQLCMIIFDGVALDSGPPAAKRRRLENAPHNIVGHRIAGPVTKVAVQVALLTFCRYCIVVVIDKLVPELRVGYSVIDGADESFILPPGPIILVETMARIDDSIHRNADIRATSPAGMLRPRFAGFKDSGSIIQMLDVELLTLQPLFDNQIGDQLELFLGYFQITVGPFNLMDWGKMLGVNPKLLVEQPKGFRHSVNVLWRWGHPGV